MNLLEEIKAFRELVLRKQDRLTPGDYIIIEDDVISADLSRVDDVEKDIRDLKAGYFAIIDKNRQQDSTLDDHESRLIDAEGNIDNLETGLSDLEEKVDNIHGFDIVPLGEGDYDPETGIPTIENPKTNTLYLVPNLDEEDQKNLWIEWLWIQSKWEQFGAASIDMNNYVKKTDYATTSKTGVVKIKQLGGLTVGSNGDLSVNPATVGDISTYTSNPLPITPSTAPDAVYYGLGRISRSGYTYSEQEKINIRQMLGATGVVADVRLDGASVLDSYGVARIPLASAGQKGVIRARSVESSPYNYGVDIPATGTPEIVPAIHSQIKGAPPDYVIKSPIVPGTQHEAVFYGLAKAAGDTTQQGAPDSEFPVGTYTPPAITAIQRMIGIGPATDETAGLVKASNISGVDVDSSGSLGLYPATQANITGRTFGQRPITPENLDFAVKAALTDGVGIEWTAAEKAAARERIGAGQGETELYYVTYSETTFTEIEDAIEDGLLPVLLYNNKQYNLTNMSSTEIAFTCVVTNKHHYCYVSPDDTWHSGTITVQTSNIATTITGYETSNTKYPSTKAVADYVESHSGVTDVTLDDVSIVDPTTGIAEIVGVEGIGTSDFGTVKDVTVNGTTIVDTTTGVAEIPMVEDTVLYNQGRLGLVSVDRWSGLNVDPNTGRISVRKSQNREITDRRAIGATSTSGCLDGSNFDFAVKAALTDGIGPAYTAAEQAAAKTRLGIDYPVKDVTMNGASIVNSSTGIADIPKMAGGGVVGVGATASTYGTTLNGDAPYISIAMAATTQIDARSQRYTPIVPSNLDYAVKAALTDGVGPAYTAAEQAAAKTRLGITPGEEGGVNVTLDDDGDIKIHGLGGYADLEDYVKDTDYASVLKGGVIRIAGRGNTLCSDGILLANELSLNEYASASVYSFISKGTLNTIITTDVVLAETTLSEDLRTLDFTFNQVPWARRISIIMHGADTKTPVGVGQNNYISWLGTTDGRVDHTIPSYVDCSYSYCYMELKQAGSEISVISHATTNGHSGSIDKLGCFQNTHVNKVNRIILSANGQTALFFAGTKVTIVAGI